MNIGKVTGLGRPRSLQLEVDPTLSLRSALLLLLSRVIKTFHSCRSRRKSARYSFFLAEEIGRKNKLSVNSSWTKKNNRNTRERKRERDESLNGEGETKEGVAEENGCRKFNKTVTSLARSIRRARKGDQTQGGEDGGGKRAEDGTTNKACPRDLEGKFNAPRNGCRVRRKIYCNANLRKKKEEKKRHADVIR